ncbi:hypothetical protein DB32_002568 [Sandaracinus amylolyticus]|uniref:Uncharacterized protein n=1 Tax=Sandaracinus amylolyticus TaxID=927083 RepID=A0A0F6SEL8_9BACT|nr:hypothetical protein DB32_002568 [Sandaracinus amylolyticus]
MTTARARALPSTRRRREARRRRFRNGNDEIHAPERHFRHGNDGARHGKRHLLQRIGENRTRNAISFSASAKTARETPFPSAQWRKPHEKRRFLQRNGENHPENGDRSLRSTKIRAAMADRRRRFTKTTERTPTGAGGLRGRRQRSPTGASCS